MDMFILVVSIYGFLAIFLGVLTNAFVILKMMRRQRAINDVFPLNMVSFLRRKLMRNLLITVFRHLLTLSVF